MELHTNVKKSVWLCNIFECCGGLNERTVVDSSLDRGQIVFPTF